MDSLAPSEVGSNGATVPPQKFSQSDFARITKLVLQDTRSNLGEVVTCEWSSKGMRVESIGKLIIRKLQGEVVTVSE
ncbi:hypothetical protein ACFX2I_014503 [Malus domestica]